MGNQGGKRAGAGRPKGSKNRVPSKSAQARAAMLEEALQFVRANLMVLEEIALAGTQAVGPITSRPWHADITVRDRIAAIRTVQELFVGKPAEEIHLTEDDDETFDIETARDLLGDWPVGE